MKLLFKAKIKGDGGKVAWLKSRARRRSSSESGTRKGIRTGAPQASTIWPTKSQTLMKRMVLYARPREKSSFR